MKKTDKKIIRMDNGIFPKNVWVFVGYSNKEIIDELKKFDKLTEYDLDSSFNNKAFAYSVQFPDGNNVIVLVNLYSAYYPMLVHELYHCIQNLVNARILNKEITMPDETIPYLLEHWMEQILIGISGQEYNRLRKI